MERCRCPHQNQEQRSESPSDDFAREGGRAPAHREDAPDCLVSERLAFRDLGLRDLAGSGHQGVLHCRAGDIAALHRRLPKLAAKVHGAGHGHAACFKSWRPATGASLRSQRRHREPACAVCHRAGNCPSIALCRVEPCSAGGGLCSHDGTAARSEHEGWSRGAASEVVRREFLWPAAAVGVGPCEASAGLPTRLRNGAFSAASMRAAAPGFQDGHPSHARTPCFGGWGGG